MTPTVRSATVGAARSRPSVASMEKHGIAKAALLGIAAGMRSSVPLAALSLTLPRRRWAGAPLALAAAAELVYDKLPRAEDRTARRPLIGRIVSGAIAGGIVARVADASVELGVAIGALAALGSTFYFHRARAAAARRVPPLAAALAEDLIAVEAARVAMRRLPRAR